MQRLMCLTSLIFTLVQGRIIPDSEECNGIIIHNINHEKQILMRDTDSPYQLAMDYDTNTLFFSVSVNTGVENFNSVYFNLKTNESGTIPNIQEGFANAVDEKKQIVYMGGSNGIYTYNFNTKKAEYLNGVTDINIWQLFFKGRSLYFTDYNTETVLVYKDGVVKVVEELRNTKASLVAVDNNDNIFFYNSSGLFCYKRAKGETIFVGDYTVNAFTVDIYGQLYFSTTNAIYAISEDDLQIDRLFGIPEVIFGLAIEANKNIIYSTRNSIIRLNPTMTTCYSAIY